MDVMNMLLLLLPGTPHTFQGEEIGMKNIQLTYEQTVDPWGRNAGPVRRTHWSCLFIFWPSFFQNPFGGYVCTLTGPPVSGFEHISFGFQCRRWETLFTLGEGEDHLSCP